jgi:Lipopolysaccharide kinase (Kdo/WaaP) family
MTEDGNVIIFALTKTSSYFSQRLWKEPRFSSSLLDGIQQRHTSSVLKLGCPTLFGFQSLPAGWYMAVMGYLDPETYRILEPEERSNTSLVAEIRQVVTVLHNGGFLHGDINFCNVNMTTRQWTAKEGVRHVFLLDFDWAGPDGTEIPTKSQRDIGETT